MLPWECFLFALDDQDGHTRAISGCNTPKIMKKGSASPKIRSLIHQERLVEPGRFISTPKVVELRVNHPAIRPPPPRMRSCLAPWEARWTSSMSGLVVLQTRGVHMVVHFGMDGTKWLVRLVLTFSFLVRLVRFPQLTPSVHHHPPSSTVSVGNNRPNSTSNSQTPVRFMVNTTPLSFLFPQLSIFQPSLRPPEAAVEGLREERPAGLAEALQAGGEPPAL